MYIHYSTRVDELHIDDDKRSMDYAKKLVNIYKNVFQGLGTIKVNATIHTDSNVPPVIDHL